MKRSRLTAFLLLLLTCTLPAGCAAPADQPADGPDAALDALDLYAAGDDRADVVGTVQLLFDALERGDEELLRSVLDPSVVMHFAEIQGGDTTYGSATVDVLATRITSAEDPLIERMWDPVVLVDGPLATVWAPYDFYAGDVFSHCGIDTVSLLRTDDGWKIVGLSWTRMQPPACALHPEGPPT